ncbi:conserved hypothetical protein [Leishmania mexicana MHOM/GT/2001/U1103]|uniref:Uncharacterized protein n=1 Tax=Leishmania mexicana (strain MHOM/GT/2001/U1103) TaxID=929439 RepID=E9B3E9_LEIMU|nr:conserved hypothetical protein [Leishmania mexicana MHOM/GT/2001/U1103]CBZ29766.1 conserved hypothetical protein [Leishmania mexicana MHOM/GT/2001/U1103]
MVSKTRKQRQKKKVAMQANGGVLPPVVPSVPKSVHLKKTRPNMKGKMKIRLGLESPIDIYSGFEERKGVLWRCPTCAKACRVLGFCVDCASGVKSKSHAGQLIGRASTKKEAAQMTAPKLRLKERNRAMKLKRKK